MKQRPMLFVLDDMLCTRTEGGVVRIHKVRRFTEEGQEITSLYPYLLGRHLVLMHRNRPVSISFIYADGTVKGALVESEYRYELDTRPLAAPKRKRSPR